MPYFSAESRLIFFGGVEQARGLEITTRVEHESVSPDGGKQIQIERMQCLAAHERTETYHAREEKQADQLLANITDCHTQGIEQKNSLTREDLIVAWKNISNAQKIDLIADLTPVIGDVKGGVEALINRTLFSGEKPKWYERVLGAVGALPAIGTPADIAKALEKLSAVALSMKALRRSEIPVGMTNVISDVEKMRPAFAVGEVQKVTKAFEARNLAKLSPYARGEFIDHQLGNLEYFANYLKNLKAGKLEVKATSTEIQNAREQVRRELVKIVEMAEKDKNLFIKSDQVRFESLKIEINKFNY